MGLSAREYWNSHFQTVLNSKRSPSPFFESIFSRIQKGKVLDVACGLGENSIFAAKNGCQVKSIDASDLAIDALSSKSQSENLAIETKAVDLDLFLFGLMEFDSILMFNFKPPVLRYYSEIVRALKMGGTLVVESLMLAEMPEPMAAEDPRNFYFTTNELIRAFKDLQILFYNETEIDGQVRVQMLARKPMDKDVAKYNLFGMGSAAQEKPKQTQRDLAEALFKKKD